MTEQNIVVSPGNPVRVTRRGDTEDRYISLALYTISADPLFPNSLCIGCAEKGREECSPYLLYSYAFEFGQNASLSRDNKVALWLRRWDPATAQLHIQLSQDYAQLAMEATNSDSRC